MPTSLHSLHPAAVDASSLSSWCTGRLNGEYAKALAQIDEQLAYWPKFLVHKNKQRLTKMTQYLIRVRRLAMRSRPKLVPIATRCTLTVEHHPALSMVPSLQHADASG